MQSDEKLWTTFAKLSKEEKIIALQTIFGVNENIAIAYYDLFMRYFQKSAFFSEIVRKNNMVSILQKLSDAKIEEFAKRKKRNQKETKLEKAFKYHFFEVDKLRRSHIGWHKISEFLKQEYKLDISYISVRRLYLKYQSILIQ